MKKILFLILPVLLFSGCAAVKDVSRGIMGTSTQELEAAKVDSIYQIYTCDIQACFDAVDSIAQENKYYVFLKDEVRGLIVLMNIPGSVDTTEVGVFLSDIPGRQGVKVELSSRSTPAKKAVAKVLFSELNALFKKS